MIKDQSGGHQRSNAGLPWRSVAGLAAALVLAAALTLAGCGPAGTAAPTATSTAVSASAEALQQQFVQIVKRVSPSVVLIQTSQGLGSGIVYDPNGDIVTNNHVVAGSSTFQVTVGNGNQYTARLIGTFPPDDLAVLHIDAPGLQPAAFADSTSLAVGDLTLAIGNPLGLQSSVSEGIVSALGRTVNEDNGVALPHVIQTSAAINPGNSGGALVNLDGQVIGIPTLAATDPQLGGGQAPGIGFAIPSNIVRNIATQLIGNGTVTNSRRAYLGVQAGTTTSSAVLVAGVRAGGPAAQAGIRAGELITAVDGTATPAPTALADVLAGLKPGQTVGVAVSAPGGTTRTVQVTVGEYGG
jgi:S1-C subfamily serine protease